MNNIVANLPNLSKTGLWYSSYHFKNHVLKTSSKTI